MHHGLVGQHATNSLAQFAFTRRLLQSQVLLVFKNAADIKNGKMLVTFREVLKAVTLDVFPKKSLVNQHWCMRRFLRKPCGMSVKDYIASVVEINSYLTDFPPVNVTTPGTMLTDNKLLDLLEFGIPVKWQKHMVMHRFNPENGIIQGFSKFCKRLENAMEDKEVLLEN